MRALAAFSFCICMVLWATPAQAIDLAPLWDFARPEVSEQRFRAVLAVGAALEAVHPQQRGPRPAPAGPLRRSAGDAVRSQGDQAMAQHCARRRAEASRR